MDGQHGIGPLVELYATATRGRSALPTPSGRVHDDRDPDGAGHRSGDVEPVRPEAVDDHPPQQRPRHEDTPVGGQDAPEVRVGPPEGLPPGDTCGDTSAAEQRAAVTSADQSPPRSGRMSIRSQLGRLALRRLWVRAARGPLPCRREIDTCRPCHRLNCSCQPDTVLPSFRFRRGAGAPLHQVGRRRHLDCLAGQPGPAR
jgi:hypothetical protein